MPELSVSCPDDSVDAAVLTVFERECRLVHGALIQLPSAAGLPDSLNVLLTRDLERIVRQRMRPQADESEGAQFEATRFGLGRVMAKNLAQDDQHANVVIVFDAAPWTNLEREPFEQAQGFLLITHELAHPLLERTRIASGVAKDVAYPSWLPGEIARSLGRVLMDEYRADWLADIVLQSVASKGEGGEPLRAWELDGEYQLSELTRVMTRAYEEVPRTVRQYRDGVIDLMTMWTTVTRWTEHLLTAFVHVRSAADGIDPPVPILSDPAFAALPFVRLYLVDTLMPLIEALRRGAILPTAEAWIELENAVTSTAEVAVREIWRRLGLTFVEPTTRGEYRINVAAPLLQTGRSPAA